MSAQDENEVVRDDLSWMARKASGLLGKKPRRSHDTMDLVQSTLRGVWPVMRKKEFRDTGHRRGFLYNALRFRAQDIGRREGRADLAIGVEPDHLPRESGTPSRAAGRREERDALLDEYARLSEPEQVILRLVLRDDLPYAEIAERVGVTEEAARKRYSRAVAKLRDRLGGSRAP